MNFHSIVSRFRPSLVFAVSCLAALGNIAIAAEPETAYTVEKNVAVPMRDGTLLRADVFRPLGKEGPFPVLVHRTPYGKGPKHAGMTKYGYVVISQDARGRYESDGEYESFNRPETHDAVDGYDTVEWAAKLPGTTGKVGMVGVSYDAFLQWRAASLNPPSLKAFAAFSIPAKYTDLEMPGTVRPGRRWEWWFTNAADIRKKDGGPQPHAKGDAKKLWDAGRGREIMDTVAWLNLPDDELFGHEAKYVKDWLRKPWIDTWKLDEDAARVTVPNLNVCGWYDHCNGSIDLHTAITQRGASDVARKESKLLIGPWSHNALGKRKQGKIDFGKDAFVDLDLLQAKWFDVYLKESEQRGTIDVKNGRSISLFVMGLGAWREFDQWPPEGTTPQSFYLSSNGGANTPRGDGRLVDDAPPKSVSDSYDYDPRDPVTTLWGKGSTFTVAAEQSPLADRRDILVYQTDELVHDVEVIGYPELTLFAASNRPDTDFFARLVDVAPDGKAIDVTHGMVRARHRESLEKVTLLTPGETVEFKIKLRPTAHRFIAGHRLRLDVTSSDYPSYDRNHNTAANPNADAELVTAKQTIRHGGEYASRLTLPVMKTLPKAADNSKR